MLIYLHNVFNIGAIVSYGVFVYILNEKALIVGVFGENSFCYCEKEDL